ncbi:ExbD/TolR family protein [Shimia sp.]|uniref:ExbD/TolR family protein n=1 Tax=Shimia sp. TaxID=1954381 RepID=UPI003BA87C6E
MNFEELRPKANAESIIPMINVVFLLLIFFLMSAEIAPPEPFQVAPPSATLDTPASGELILFVDAEGIVGFEDVVGRNTEDLAALDAIVQSYLALCGAPDCDVIVRIRADQQAPAQAVARLLPKLAEAGVRKAEFVTVVQ